MADASTIFALSSGPGKAGVAVIRVSGPAVREALARMAPPDVLDRRAALRRIVHPVTGDVLDHALVLYFAGPRSETGEDVAEFQVHGGRAVVRAVLDALGAVPGCRIAGPGEFARRAFANGKLDLVEIEALADLVEADTEAQRRLALRSGGVLSTLYQGWRSNLIEIAALTEAAIDFSDEGDVGAQSLEMGRVRARPLLSAIRAHLNDGHRGEILRDGFRVAILGAPNAGKSSLLNALARREAAIVSEEAGTTRDVIEVRLDLGGLPVIVLDTAGLREAAGTIEREGIRRSLKAAEDAQLVFWLTETGLDSPPESISRETYVVVRSKVDLPQCQAPKATVMAMSTRTGAGIDALIRLIAARAGEAVGNSSDQPVITQARHRQQLEASARSLETFLAGNPEAMELRAEDVRQAAHALGRITGRVDVEDVLGHIFSRFCIGK